jgi:hypothetical protein
MIRHSMMTGLLALTISAPALAQKIGQTQSPVLARGEAAMRNLSNNTELQFYLRELGEEWTLFHLRPGESRMVPCGTRSEFFMATLGRPPAQYRILPGRRYAIDWSVGSSRWDLFEVSR